MVKTLLLLSGYALLLLPGFAQRNILQEELKKVNYEQMFGPLNADPFSDWQKAAFWEALPFSLKQAYIAEGEKLTGKDYVLLPATGFLEFARNGNRSNFQNLQNQRRHMLQTLVIAECMERKGRFLDKIADGIWALCEESYWGVPAHLYLQKNGYGLPDVTEPTVDLFASETVALLAIIHHLLEKELKTVSPIIAERILYEAQRRVLTPNLLRNDFWWMSFDASLNNGTINNWNPWINSNWLLAVMLLEKDPLRKRQAIEKIIRSLDLFMNSYPEDGGCDEGPAYWGRAGGSLFDALEMLYQFSGGRFNVFSHPLVQNIGNYIYRAHIHDRYFVNFADASAKVNISAPTVFLYGVRTGNDTLKALAANAVRMQEFDKKISPATGLFRNLQSFGILKDMFSFDRTFVKSPFNYMPGVQVMIARSTDANNNELMLAAQGGHNAESHNHNDVGNFIVYRNGKPVLIDVGVETYTAKTFSKDRYEIWTMQSAYHNVPTINGIQQKEGRAYEAIDVIAQPRENGARFSLDMAKAYPAEAHAIYWKRQIVLENAESLTLTDAFQLNKISGASSFHFMTAVKPLIEQNGILIPYGDAAMLLNYDVKRLTAAIEEIEITDSQLQTNWGRNIYRISLKVKKPKIRERYQFKLVAQ